MAVLPADRCGSIELNGESLALEVQVKARLLQLPERTSEKILDHRGIVLNSLVGALARVGSQRFEFDLAHG
jgi:hypothetical protein